LLVREVPRLPRLKRGNLSPQQNTHIKHFDSLHPGICDGHAHRRHLFDL
jgi:hypothetical protein